MRTRALLVALFGFALLTNGVGAEPYDEDDESGYGGGDEEDYPPPPPDDEGYGGGGGDGGKELLSLDDFEAFLDDKDASVIAGFTAKEIIDPKAQMPEGWDEEEDGAWEAPTIENPFYTEFKSISSSQYDYRWAWTTTPEVLEKLKCKKTGLFLFRSPKFLSTKDGDRPRERFPSDTLSETAVSNWLVKKAQPLVGLFSSSTKERYKDGVLVIFMNLDFEKNDKGVKYVLKRARKAAAALKGKKLAIAVGALSDFSYELADYGLVASKGGNDILMGIKAGSDYYGATAYFDEKGTSAGFSGTTLTAFADAYLAGELTPHVKPEEPPPAGDDDEYKGGEEGEEEEPSDEKEEM